MHTPPSNDDARRDDGDRLSGFYRRTPGGGFEEVADPRPEPFDWTREREAWTVSQIAHAMGRTGVSVGTSTVRGWCEQGLLKATKTSKRGHYRVTAAALRAFLNGDDAPAPRAA